MCSCWGCSPIPARCPLPPFNPQGSYQRGRLLWESCSSFSFSSPLTDRDPQCGQRAPVPRQLLEKLPISSRAVYLQHRYLTWFSILFGTLLMPFLALVETLLIYSWCHMKSEAGALLLPSSHLGLPCSPCSSQWGSLSACLSLRTCSGPSLNSVLTCTGCFFICLPLFFFSLFFKGN